MPRLADHGPDWTKSWGSLGVVSPSGGAAPGDLLHLHDPGHCGLTFCYSLGLLWQRPAAAERAPGLNAIGVGLVLEGGCAVSVGENRFSCAPGEGFVFDLTKDFQILHDSLTTTKVCILWLPRLRLRLASLHLARGLGFSPDTLPGAVLAASLQALASRIDTTEAAELGPLVAGLAALTTAAVQASVEHQVKWGREAKVGAILKFIDANLTSSLLEPDRVAGQFGLSRASLYRLFEPLGGVAGYIRERRLQRAMEDLTARGSPSRSIAAVGRKMGYPDAASFTRAFRAQFGMTPSAVIRMRKESGNARDKAAGAAPATLKGLTLASCLQDLNSRRG